LEETKTMIPAFFMRNIIIVNFYRSFTVKQAGFLAPITGIIGTRRRPQSYALLLRGVFRQCCQHVLIYGANRVSYSRVLI